MDLVIRIGTYTVIGAILLVLNGLYLRRVYREFNRVEPSPVIAPFRVVGVKEEQEKGKVLAQMLIARLNRLNDELSGAMRVLNQSSASKAENASVPLASIQPADIRFDSPAPLDDQPFGEFEPVDVNLSFGGVELGGIVSWAQKFAMSDRMVSISVHYDGTKTTLSMTPSRSAGDSIWLEMEGTDDRVMITDLAYAFVKRGWEATDEDIKKLTLPEFKTLTNMIQQAARVKTAGDRATAKDYAALETQIDQLLTPYSRAWESQRILKMCAVIADTAGNSSRAMALYDRLLPADEKEQKWLQAKKERLAPLVADTTEVAIALMPAPAPVPAPVPVSEHIAAAAPAPSAKPVLAETAPAPMSGPVASTPAPVAPAPTEPVASTPDPVATVAAESKGPPAGYLMPGMRSLLDQLHVPDSEMEGEPLVAIIGPDPDPRVGEFVSLSPPLNRKEPMMTEYSTHLAELVRLIAPKSKLAFMYVESVDPNEMRHALEIIEKRGAKIVLLTYGPLPPPTEAAIAAVSDRMLVVTAAGNRGRGVPPNMMTAADRVLVVSAVDGRGDPAVFTQFSTQSVWAPGIGIVFASLQSKPTERSGTSYAAAIAAGAAARVLGLNPDLNPAQVVKLLRESSRKVGSTGLPMLDVSKAVIAARRTA